MIYIAFLYFQLVTHTHLYEEEEDDDDDEVRRCRLTLSNPR